MSTTPPAPPTASTTRPPLRRVAVFCGSSPGKSPAYKEAAVALGKEIAARGLGLVYGGGNVGLMGAVAEAAAAGGAPVTGVIPSALQPREISGATVGERVVVPDMHSRKRTMFELSDGFVALPGGFGTLEEIIEMCTWHQLGYHSKPVVFLNAGGFYDPLLSFFDHAAGAGFISAGVRAIAMAADSPAACLDALAAYERVTPPVFQAPEAGGALTTEELS